MTFPDPTYQHVHVSEREPDGSFEDCLWASAVEVLRYGGLRIPATLAEAEALRKASGEPPTGGSNQGDLWTGIATRYAVIPHQGIGFGELWENLRPGSAAAVNGKLTAFPTGHTLRRHDPTYTGGHAVAVFRVDAQNRVWWCDPLGPRTGYDGQWASGDQLRLFMAKLDGRYTRVARGEYATPDPPPPPPEDPMARSIVAGEGRRFASSSAAVLASGTPIYRDDRGTVLLTTTRETVVDDFGWAPGFAGHRAVGLATSAFDPDGWGIGFVREGPGVRLRDKTADELRDTATRFAGVDCTEEVAAAVGPLKKSLDIANGRIRTAVSALGGSM